MKIWHLPALWLCMSTGALAETIKFSSVTLDWPDGYQAQLAENEIHMLGGNGERVTVIQFNLEPGVEDAEALAKTDTLRAYAEEELPKSAASEGGTVARALQRTDIDPRHTLFSMASQLREDRQPHYLLEYFLVGRSGGAYFSIAGNGEPAAALAVFDPVFASARWNDMTADAADAAPQTADTPAASAP